MNRLNLLPAMRLPSRSIHASQPAGLSALLCLAGVLSLFPQGARAVPAQPQSRWEHIKTALFFTSDNVDDLLGTPEARQATLA